MGRMNRILCILKFLNITNPITNALEPSKILLWGVTVTILTVMFSTLKAGMTLVDMGAFTGVLTTLVGVFAAVIKLTEGKYDEDEERNNGSTPDRNNERSNRTFPRDGDRSTREDYR